MFDITPPTVKKINKTAVAVVAAVIVGGYVIFGFKNIGKKPEFSSFEITEVETKVKMDAPQFIQTRSYNNIEYASVNPLEDVPVSDQRLDPLPVPEIKPVPATQPDVTKHNATVTPYVPQSYKMGTQSSTVSPEYLADNSPSGWSSNNTRSNSTGIPASGFDYNNLSTPDMPDTEALVRGLKGEGGGSSRDKFMSNMSKHEDIYLSETIETPKSPYQLMAGSIIPCTLISGINSDLPGDLVAQVRGQVYDSVTGRHLLVPHGTRFVGSYDSGVLFGQQRCLFAWKRMIFPDGRSIQLRGMSGADLAGYAGVKDSVDYHYMRLTGAVLMSAFMAIGTEKLDNGNAFRSTMAEDINRSGQKIVDMQLDVQPTIKIAPATPFNIMVNKDMVLSPYHKG